MTIQQDINKRVVEKLAEAVLDDGNPYIADMAKLLTGRIPTTNTTTTNTVGTLDGQPGAVYDNVSTDTTPSEIDIVDLLNRLHT